MVRVLFQFDFKMSLITWDAIELDAKPQNSNELAISVIAISIFLN